MLKRLICLGKVFVFGSTLTWAAAASAAWLLNEVFSNADRSVQFVVHSTGESGQQNLGGLTLVVSGEGMTHTFTFPNDLPGNSSGRSFLIATQGFADLNVLQPDYVVPNGFFPTSGGAISVAGHSNEYRTVPTDGTQAYWRDPDFFNWYAPAAATNFAGGRYTFTAATLAPPIGPGITGAWFDPAQSGHGLFIEVLPDNRFLPGGSRSTLPAPNRLVPRHRYLRGNTATINAVYQPTGGRWIPNFDPSHM